MKTIIATLTLCVFATANLMAQARVNFSNNSSTPIRIGVASDGSGSVVLGTASTALFGIGPASTRIRLYASANSSDLGTQSTLDLAANYNNFSPLAMSLSPVLIGSTASFTSVTNTSATFASVQGAFSGGTIVPIPGNTGTPMFFRFTAETLNGFYAGVSSIIQVTPSLSPELPENMFAAGPDTASTWGGITMVIVTPEPSALALLGLGSVMILRRRR